MKQILLGILTFCVTLTSQADVLALNIRAQDWAPTLHVYCDNVSCENITIRSIWNDAPNGKIGPINRKELKSYLLDYKFKKLFITPSVGDIQFDSSAGALNVVVPFIWIVGGAIALGIDGYELVSDQQSKMQKRIAKLDAALNSRTITNVEIDRKSFERLYKLFEKFATKSKK